ncbi:MAG: ACT domain-containing protein [Oscillospiraceae bacterium]|nr:ACT domain-containing protein [Oscillospiraceae bacterium]
MLVKQISVFVENKPGKLSAVTRLLADNNVDIRAFSVADSRDFGILRLIVNDPEKASEVLKAAEVTISVTNVIAVCIGDRPGGLAEAVDCLYKSNISVEYMYAFVEKSGDNAFAILRVENNDKALEALTEGGFTILKAEQVYSI